MHDLATRFASMGGQMLTSTRAVELLIEDKRVVGAVVEREGKRAEIRAGAVLIADGGFQGNAELVRRYITPRPDLLCMRNAGTGIGDGLLMAQAAGAALVNMESFYGHVQCLEAIGNDSLWPYPILDHLTTTGIVVDAAGRRFADEGLGGVATANAIARLERPDTAVVVFDEAIWQGPGKSRRVPPNPNLLAAGVKLFSAQTADQLALQLGMEPSVLGATIQSYNEAIVSNRLQSLSPPRSDANSSAMSLNAPLYALRASAGITYTMGGISTDAHARVHHRDGAFIEGLFAAGSTAAGLEGGPLTGYVGGLAKAVVFALRAAEYVAREKI